MMLQKHKNRILLSSALILLPALAGLVLWDRLPEQMVLHWGFSGGTDSRIDRFLTVLALPLIFLAMYIICLFFTLRDPKNRNQSGKALGLVFWLFPVISILSSGIMYASAFGMIFSEPRLMPLMLGLMFAVIGNYLPKCRQNQTLGIRVKWSLENEENWNATHRASGRMWMIGGLLLCLCAFLPQRFFSGAMFLPLLLIGVCPPLYSYLYYRRQLKLGAVEKPVPAPFTWKKTLNTLLPALLLLFILVSLFTGNISYEYGEDCFTVHASYWPDKTIAYADIEQIEYRDADSPGTRTNGYGSFQLLMGSFSNDEFGFYTRYSYTRCPSCVVLTINGQILVLTGRDTAETQALYENLQSYIS